MYRFFKMRRSLWSAIIDNDFLRTNSASSSKILPSFFGVLKRSIIFTIFLIFVALRFAAVYKQVVAFENFSSRFYNLFCFFSFPTDEINIVRISKVFNQSWDQMFVKFQATRANRLLLREHFHCCISFIASDGANFVVVWMTCLSISWEPLNMEWKCSFRETVQGLLIESFQFCGIIFLKIPWKAWDELCIELISIV